MTGNERSEGGDDVAGAGGQTLGPDALPPELFAAVRSDFAGLEEVCRWQWNLIRRLSGHLARLPPDWPDRPGPPGGGQQG